MKEGRGVVITVPRSGGGSFLLLSTKEHMKKLLIFLILISPLPAHSQGFSSSAKIPKYSSEPSIAANGDMYYNTTTNKFRCYQNSAWTDCISSGSISGTISNDQVVCGAGSSSIDSSSNFTCGASPQIGGSNICTVSTCADLTGATFTGTMVSSVPSGLSWTTGTNLDFSVGANGTGIFNIVASTSQNNFFKLYTTGVADVSKNFCGITNSGNSSPHLSGSNICYSTTSPIIANRFIGVIDDGVDGTAGGAAVLIQGFEATEGFGSTTNALDVADIVRINNFITGVLAITKDGFLYSPDNVGVACGTNGVTNAVCVNEGLGVNGSISIAGGSSIIAVTGNAHFIDTQSSIAATTAGWTFRENGSTFVRAIYGDGLVASITQTKTVSNNAGAVATDTLDPTSQVIDIVCNDASEGCDITFQETTASSINRAVNIEICIITQTAGVTKFPAVANVFACGDSNVTTTGLNVNDCFSASYRNGIWLCTGTQAN